jgi:hypothetical protein
MKPAIALVDGATIDLISRGGSAVCRRLTYTYTKE